MRFAQSRKIVKRLAQDTKERVIISDLRFHAQIKERLNARYLVVSHAKFLKERYGDRSTGRGDILPR